MGVRPVISPAAAGTKSGKLAAAGTKTKKEMAKKRTAVAASPQECVGVKDQTVDGQTHLVRTPTVDGRTSESESESGGSGWIQIDRKRKQGETSGKPIKRVNQGAPQKSSFFL